MRYIEHYKGLHPCSELDSSGYPVVSPCFIYGLGACIFEDCAYADCNKVWDSEMRNISEYERIQAMSIEEMAKLLVVHECRDNTQAVCTYFTTDGEEFCHALKKQDVMYNKAIQHQIELLRGKAK